MKKLQFFLLAAVAIVFAACSNDDVVLTDTGTSTIEAGGDGYMAIAISMPAQTSTRTSDSNNDQFKDGESSEYAVNDAILLLFSAGKNSKESTAVCYAAYPLTGLDEDVIGSDGNVTAKETVTQEITTPSNSDDKMYALVLLNSSGVITLTGSGTADDGCSVATVDGDELMDGTFEDIQEYLQTASYTSMTKHGFFMTNAPFYTNPGGANNPLTTGSLMTLAVVNRDNIHASESEADAGDPAVIVYVERGVAKVTVRQESTLDNLIAAGNLQDVDFTANGYALDVTNKQSYIIRNIGTSYLPLKSLYVGTDYDMTSASSPYRFVSGANVLHDAAQANVQLDGTYLGNNLYRTYWGEDPNYSSAATYDESDLSSNEDFNYIEDLADYTSKEETTFSSTTKDYPLYCYENTFDLSHQKQRYTTRLIVKGQFNLDESASTVPSFFTVDNDKKHVYPATTVTGYETINEYIINLIVNSTAMEDAIDGYTLDDKETDISDLFTITWGSSLAASTDAEFSVTFTGTGEGADAVTNALGNSESGVVKDLNDAHEFAYYPNGECYYAVLIKHFGDDLTPWESEVVKNAGGTDTNCYPADGIDATDENETGDADWLGRYGVLRNNWYDITITGVEELGSPTLPDRPDKYDDVISSYLKCEICILSWAKRTQDVTL